MGGRSTDRTPEPRRQRVLAGVLLLAALLVAGWLAWDEAQLPAQEPLAPLTSLAPAPPPEPTTPGPAPVAPPPVVFADAGPPAATPGAPAPPELEAELPSFGFCDPPGTSQAAARTPTKYRLYERPDSRTWRTGVGHDTVTELARLQNRDPRPWEQDTNDLRQAALLAETPRVAEARAAYLRYLKRNPGDGVVGQRYERLGTQLEIQTDYAQANTQGITVWYAREALSESRAWRLAAEVRRALDDAAAFTQTAARPTLTVVVYPTKTELLAVSCVPLWSGGLFDGTLRLFAARGDVDPEAVRHESLHAQVSPLVSTMPTWFSEGLAETFSDSDSAGWRRAQQLLAHKRLQFPFGRLVGSFRVFERNEDANLAYAQSEAMVRWLVAAMGPQVVARAVAELRRGVEPWALLGTLDPGGGLTEAAFTHWLLTSGAPAGAPAP